MIFGGKNGINDLCGDLIGFFERKLDFMKNRK